MFKCISNTLEENFNFLNSFFKSLKIFKNFICYGCGEVWGKYESYC